jgi:transglutaminase-like putative cysteine protease
MKPKISTCFLLLFSFFVSAQKLEYTALTIPDSLKQNANAVMRSNHLTIDIPSQSKMIIKSVRVITVLNELGLRSMGLVEQYDKNSKINKIEATAYDSFGKELKTYKRKDFKDQSATDDGTIFSDSRILYLDYTPITYPFTMVYESESESSNTVFIPSWRPIEGYLVSTQKTSLTINFKPELKLKTKELNFTDQFPIEKKETVSSVSYSANNLIARRAEELAPKFDSIFPIVMFGLSSFSLEGVNGNADSWKEMGKWFHDKILSGTDELSEETKIKVKNLVGNETDPLQKAAIIYKYVQEKTRYVSIQEGIGGWRPMLAKDVDKLGYGDCKALTNYTKTLLEQVGVTSYYTRLYGDPNKKEINTDIVSFQSNHVILAIPDKANYIWLECTSQTLPFGFQGNFTDDRNAFVIKPEGGEIVRTKTFTETDNLRSIKGSYQITPEGDLSGKLKIVSKGLKYDNYFGRERESREDQIKTYKEEFSNINNLTIKKISLNNNPKTIEFVEDLELEAEGYAQNSGGKLLFALNAFDQSSYVPKKHRTREFAFQTERGYTDEAEIEITLPEGFIVEAKPDGITLDTEFGYYKIEFTTVNAGKIVCKRRLVIKKGFYDKSKYESYRKFRETLAKNDNSKIVITKA